jgi:YidC/Oxa1 family membrane protein insertase
LDLLLAYNIFDGIVAGLGTLLTAINGVTHNFGWSLVALAAIIKLAFWPLNTFQYQSIAKMQVIQPKLKALQTKHKDDPQKLQAETMALYKESGVNPFASCFPLLVQMPILFSLYRAIAIGQKQFSQTHFLWIGSSLSASFPQLIAPSLAAPDNVLLALYVLSMYFSVRLGSPPSTDPQQAQTQKMMAFISPLMIAFVGRSWPSALIVYWLTFNLFTVAQQFILTRHFAPQTAAAGGGAPANAAPQAEAAAPKSVPAARNGSSRRSRRRSRR